MPEEEIKSKNVAAPKKEDTINPEELEWIQLNKDLANHRADGQPKAESARDRFSRKFAENPFIPVGMGLTTFCLMAGLLKFARKDSAGSQIMMRGRILAQGFTVFALLAGIYHKVQRDQQPGLGQEAAASPSPT